MSKKETNETRPQEPVAPKKSINWSAFKTNVITAFVFVTLGLIGGYFTTINVHSDARAAVVQDIKIVSKASEQPQK